MGDKIKIVPHTEVFADSEIVMRVIGYNHYKLSDGSGEFAGVVFDMVGVMNSSVYMNTTATNAGGWPATQIRAYLNDTVFSELPQNWKTLIKEVQVLSSAGESSIDIITSNDNLFILSAAEIGFNTDAVPYKNEIDGETEEITFSVFTDNTSRIKKFFNGEGTAASYWFRSPNPTDSSSFHAMFNYGLGSSLPHNWAHCTSFALCM